VVAAFDWTWGFSVAGARAEEGASTGKTLENSAKITISASKGLFLTGLHELLRFD
jgi:hypothetical protein